MSTFMILRSVMGRSAGRRNRRGWRGAGETPSITIIGVFIHPLCLGSDKVPVAGKPRAIRHPTRCARSRFAPSIDAISRAYVGNQVIAAPRFFAIGISGRSPLRRGCRKLGGHLRPSCGSSVSLERCRYWRRRTFPLTGPSLFLKTAPFSNKVLSLTCPFIGSIWKYSGLGDGCWPEPFIRKPPNR